MECYFTLHPVNYAAGCLKKEREIKPAEASFLLLLLLLFEVSNLSLLFVYNVSHTWQLGGDRQTDRPGAVHAWLMLVSFLCYLPPIQPAAKSNAIPLTNLSFVSKRVKHTKPFRRVGTLFCLNLVIYKAPPHPLNTKQVPD